MSPSYIDKHVCAFSVLAWGGGGVNPASGNRSGGGGVIRYDQ